mmetsp:Transcript_12402/g.43175  ORF Transcript_12402/g.43175 Transcript_12402/m.43175 type:complete len:216 (-) Transcript_12402:894-1541(-)
MIVQRIYIPLQDEIRMIISALNLETGIPDKKSRCRSSSLTDGILIDSQLSKSSWSRLPIYKVTQGAQSKIGHKHPENQKCTTSSMKPEESGIQVERPLNALHKAGQQQWFYQLCRKLYIGRKLFSVKELGLLRNENVVAVLSVVLPHEHIVPPDAIKALGFRHLEINVREGDPLTLLQLVNGIKFINSIIQMRGGSIYVHCRLGRVRCVMLCVVG